MSDYAQTITMPATNAVQLQLPSGALIQSLTVNNQSNGAIEVFPGSQIGGASPAFTIPANGAATMPIASQQIVSLVCSGTAGTIYAHVIDQPLSSQSSAIPIPVPPALQAPFTLAFDQGLRNAVYNAQNLGNYAGVFCNFLVQFAGAPPAGGSVYVTRLRVFGLPDYAVVTLDTGQGGVGVPSMSRAFRGPIDHDFANPLLLGPAFIVGVNEIQLVLGYWNVDSTTRLPVSVLVEGYVQ